MPAPSDAELLNRWQEDKAETSFRTLVERYAGLVYKAALRTCGDAQMAEEASQSTFITLAGKAGTLAARDSLAGWLHVTAMFHAKNLSSRHEREQRKRERLEQHLDVMSAEQPLSGWRKLEPVLDEALAALSKGDREAILLRHYRALSIREIAACFSISADAAQKRVDRAMERLRARLSRHGYSAGASLGAALLAGMAVDAEAGIPLAHSFASKSLAAAPHAAGAFLPTLLLLSLMKKIAIAVAVLALLVAGIDAFKTDPSDKRTASSAPAAKGSRNSRPGASGGEKITKASLAKERVGLLEEKYGVDRTRRSRDAASDCIAQSTKSLELFEKMLEFEKASFTWASFPFSFGADIELSPGQETAANEIALRFAERQVALQRSCLERLSADPTSLMELLLASDACARGEMAEEAYVSLRASLADGVRGVSDPVSSNGRGVNFGTMEAPQTEATFMAEFRANLTTPRQLELFDAEAKGASKPGTSSFAALEPTDLDFLATKMSATLKLVGGLVDQIEVEQKMPESD